MARIGIYAGTFDPVHKGHLAFAQEALGHAQLDEVVFVPERSPQHKHGLTSYELRLKMVQLATKKMPGLATLELESEHFTVQNTVPQLQVLYPRASLVFLFGSDVVAHMASWPQIGELLKTSELVIGLRGDDQEVAVTKTIQRWKTQPMAIHVVTAKGYESVSSTNIRNILASDGRSADVVQEISEYIREYQLYH